MNSVYLVINPSIDQTVIRRKKKKKKKVKKRTHPVIYYNKYNVAVIPNIEQFDSPWSGCVL